MADGDRGACVSSKRIAGASRGCRKGWDQRADRSVKIQPPLLDQLHHRGGNYGLGDAGHEKDGARLELGACFKPLIHVSARIRTSEAKRAWWQQFAVPSDGDAHARGGATGYELLAAGVEELEVQPELVVVCRRRKRAMSSSASSCRSGSIQGCGEHNRRGRRWPQVGGCTPNALHMVKPRCRMQAPHAAKDAESECPVLKTKYHPIIRDWQRHGDAAFVGQWALSAQSAGTGREKPAKTWPLVLRAAVQDAH